MLSSRWTSLRWKGDAALEAIQELLGHSTIEMTMRYDHLTPSTLIGAVAALDPRQHHDSTTSLLELKTGS
ncbi:hypothetical protein PPSIR1_20869 [Plesiocystis pacifica SIR-1]|uniref:Tyr recombinase domain-containing protein n=2 Tax=Plesiocystis pacifica TaxID=191768 RepID=A6GGT9_9BACT|nr:hypothetical protein PPSIR1_20869 [Plesiocystis pacifica SIR-1]